MSHLDILNQIFEVVSENLENGTPRYIYSAAIYAKWSKGDDVEKDLASRIAIVFADQLEWHMGLDYSNTKHRPDRLERKYYCEKWVEGRRDQYSDHPGLLAALDLLVQELGLEKK